MACRRPMLAMAAATAVVAVVAPRHWIRAVVVRVGQLEDQVRGLEHSRNRTAPNLLIASCRTSCESSRRMLSSASRSSAGTVASCPRRSELPNSDGVAVAPPPAAPTAAAAGTDGVAAADDGVTAAGAGTKPPRDDAFDPSKDPECTRRAAAARRRGGHGGPCDRGSRRGAKWAARWRHRRRCADKSVEPASGRSASVPATTSTATPGLRPSSTPEAQSGLTTPDGTVVADRQADQPKEQYDIALAYMKQKDYDDAERGFSTMSPKPERPGAYRMRSISSEKPAYLRGRQRRSGRAIFEDLGPLPNSPRAPEAMLRLGHTLMRSAPRNRPVRPSAKCRVNIRTLRGGHKGERGGRPNAPVLKRRGAGSRSRICTRRPVRYGLCADIAVDIFGRRYKPALHPERRAWRSPRRLRGA